MPHTPGLLPRAPPMLSRCRTPAPGPVSLPMVGWRGAGARCAGSALSLVLQGARTRVSSSGGVGGGGLALLPGLLQPPPSHPILPPRSLQPPHKSRDPPQPRAPWPLCQPSRARSPHFCPPPWKRGAVAKHPSWGPGTPCHQPVWLLSVAGVRLPLVARSSGDVRNQQISEKRFRWVSISLNSWLTSIFTLGVPGSAGAGGCRAAGRWLARPRGSDPRAGPCRDP